MPLDTLHPKPPGDSPRAKHRQELMVVLANIGLLAAGMSLGMPTVTLPALLDSKQEIHIDKDQASWFASINALSCPLGGVVSALLLDRIGRKMALYIVNLLNLTAWALMALALSTNVDLVFAQLLVSRFFSGVAMGMASTPAGVYTAEISTAKTRGYLILGTSVAIAAGIMIIYLIGYFIREDWHLIAAILCGYQVVAMICVIPLPETPSWLLSKGRTEEAQKSLNYFRGFNKDPEISNPDVLAEFNLLRKNIQLGAEAVHQPFTKKLRLPEVYKPLLILIGLFIFQQVTGIIVVVVYAVQISTEAGVSIDPFLCAVMIGAGRLLTTLPLGLVLEHWGRRCAGMISACGMGITMLLLALQGWVDWLHHIPYLPTVAIVGFIVVSTIGLYTLPFVMISELFPQKVRGPASGVTVAVGMFVSFLCLKTYPSFKELVGNSFCFLLFSVMSILAMVYIYFLLPETRGRTLLEIEEEFRSGKRQNGAPATAEEMQQVLTRR